MKFKKELITQRDPKSPVSEVFRTLRTNIQFMDTSKKMKIFETSNGREWVGMRDCCLEMLEKTEMFAHYSPLKLRKSHREKPKGP